MKRFKKYTLIIPSCILLAGGIAACKKSFLDKAPLGTLNQQILANEAGVQGLLIGTYSLVDGEGSSGDGIGSAASNWLFGGIAADDAYKGSDPSDGGADWLPIETHAVTSTNPSCSQKFKLCYGAIQRANDVLRTMALATDIKPEEATTIRAETRFLRGFFHFELKRIFNMVPYVDETVVTTNANVDLSNTTDIYPKIEADFQAAVDSLPETQPQVGRVNKSAAKAFLAKVYMYEHKYAEAKAIFDDIIPHGQTSDGKPYDLLPNYFSNFNPAQKNSQESVFAAQTSVNDNSSTAWSGEPNGNFGDILTSLTMVVLEVAAVFTILLMI